jgi:Tfp pilus assembly protein PilF
LGRSASDAGELTQARAFLRQAALLDATNVEAQAALGRVFKRQGNQDETIAAYRRALELNPNHNWANPMLGLIMVKRGEWKEVVRVGKKAAEVSGYGQQRANSLAMVGRASRQLYDFSEACEAFSRTFAIEPNEETRAQLKKLDCADEP